MLQEINRNNIRYIREPRFREYAEMYLDIFDGFIEQVEGFGLPFDKAGGYNQESAYLTRELKDSGKILARCDDASLVYGHISCACEACKKGVDTITSYISFRCHRHCFFCFNPNQDNYESYLSEKNNCIAELERIASAGGVLSHIALTGGEPLLFAADSVAFFQRARELFPQAHLRLYTSGDLFTEETLAAFASAGLDELRFSFKMEDAEPLQEKVLANMALAKKYIRDVMVEMPVMPDCEAEMRRLLERLNDIGIRGINLLELCFPYNNAAAFRERGYGLKYPPYRTLYNFWYAGGLPVAKSETVALRLMKYAAERELSIGIHYCSLENKNFGQMYHQNYLTKLHDDTMLFSEKDYYLKTVKAFGKDALTVKSLFDRRGVTDYSYDKQAGYICFHPRLASGLKGRSIELALSVNVVEEREGGSITRELKLLRADAEDCAPEKL